MKLFCAGVGAQFPDIENASRRIKASEVKSCSANGVTQIAEIQVGLDGIAFGTSKKTTSFPLTTVDIYKAIAATPVWQEEHRQDLEGRQRQAAGGADPGLSARRRFRAPATRSAS